MRAIADGDAQRVHDGLASLGYLPDPAAFDPDALLELLADRAASGCSPPASAGSTRSTSRRPWSCGYPPRSPYFAADAPHEHPPPTLLLRRMEVQLLALLGEFNAGSRLGRDRRRAPLASQ